MPTVIAQNAAAASACEPKRRRGPNYRLIKMHRPYTVAEAARLLGVHKNTTLRWIKDGLPLIAGGRPRLVHGRDLIDFLKERSASKKNSLLPGQLYCVRCRAPKFPAGGMADYLPRTDKIGNLRGICPDCNSMMHRCVSLAKLGRVRAEMDISFPQALLRLAVLQRPTVNSDFKGDAEQ